MKEGWKYMKLGEIVVFDKRFKGVPKEQQKQIVSFKHVSAETLKGLHVDNGDVKLLATGLFTGYTTQELAGNNLNSGEVISFPTGGNANIKYHKGNFVDSGNILCVAKDDSIYLKYVHFGLLYQNDYIESCYKGTGIHHPFMPDIWDVKVPIPDISTQYSIVARLDAEFAKIEALKANAEKQLQAVKDLFQAALKELLTPKEGWGEKKLKELGKTQTGCTPSMSNKDYYNDNYIPFVKPSEINYDGLGGINYETQMLSKLGANAGRVFPAKSIFMVCIGATISKLGYSVRDVSCNQQINVITPNEMYDYKYIYYAMLHPHFIQKVIKEGTSAQATLPIISKGKWEVLSIKIPSLSEQQRIAARLDALSANVKALQTNYTETITLCNDLKQALLKKVFE